MLVCQITLYGVLISKHSNLYVQYCFEIKVKAEVLMFYMYLYM